MFAETAVQIVKELYSSSWLPAYHEQEIRKIIQEVNALDTLIVEKVSMADQQEVSCALLVHFQSVLRNKRCVLAYLMNRLRKIEQVWWETGPVIQSEARDLLSRHEMEFLSEYDRILEEYMGLEDVDINLDQHPPTSLYVECRALEDCGEIDTDNGMVQLEANTVHFLRRRDAELLIRKGMLEQLE